VGCIDTTARLGQIAVPTLVLAGELDQGTPVDMARTLAAAIPDARLQVLADASHLGALEQPGAFTAAVTAFVDML
jgi:3-oxoadipate enol-lactonase